MVPLVIDHAYDVAPAGPLAVLPLDAAQTCAGTGVMVAVVPLPDETPAAYSRVGPASAATGKASDSSMHTAAAIVASN